MSDTVQAWRTPLALIPDQFRLKQIRDASGNVKTWEEVYDENPNYEIYTDINGKPINPTTQNTIWKDNENRISASEQGHMDRVNADMADNERIRTQVSGMLDYVPFVGDGIEGYSILKDLDKGNYSDASLKLSTFILPTVLNKPARKLGNFVIDLYGKFRGSNKELTDKVRKAIEYYKNSGFVTDDISVSQFKKDLRRDKVNTLGMKDKDLKNLLAARNNTIMQSLPNNRSVVINTSPDIGSELRGTLYNGRNEIGYIDYSFPFDKPYARPDMVKNTSESQHKVAEDLYNSVIAYIQQQGGKGLVSGETLLSPEYTLATLKHYPSKMKGTSVGTWKWKTGTTENNPTYLLEQVSARGVQPTKSANSFHPSLISNSGQINFPNWEDTRVRYKRGGRIFLKLKNKNI